MLNSTKKLRVPGVAGRVFKGESNRDSKSFQRFLRPYSSYSISSFDSAWNLPSTFKSLLGSRGLIIGATETLSSEYTQRMWFEMQKSGMEGVFCGIRTPFPSDPLVRESSNIFRRTGCTSIIAIGNGAIADYAKIVRQHVSGGPNQEENRVCLAVVPTTISAVYTSASLGLLHAEDDVLEFSLSDQPELVIFDSTIIGKSPHVSSHGSLSYLLSNLFDLLVALHLVKSQNQSLFAELVGKLKNSVGITALSKYIQQPNLLEEGKSLENSILCDLRRDSPAPYSNNVVPTTAMSGMMLAAAEIGALRSIAQREIGSISAANFPALVETAAMSNLLHENSPGLLPFSWVSAASFGSLLKVAVEDGLQSADRSSDCVAIAAEEALRSVEALLGVDKQAILSQVLGSVSRFREVAKKKPSLFRRPLQLGSGIDSFVASGCIEKWILVEEMKVEAKGNHREFLVSRAQKDSQDISMRMKLLRSDLLLDILQTPCS